jgi:rubrerythrin
MNPHPVWAYDGSDTGFVSCDGNFIHRPERRDCPSKVPRAIVIAEPGDAGINCSTDADCADQPFGFCFVRPPEEMTVPGTSCGAGCLRDEHCPADHVCLCGDPVGTCVAATCKTDADCGDFLCTSSPTISPCGPVEPGEFVCQTSVDTCGGLDDCPAVLPPESCVPRHPEGRACSTTGICGRPFLVDGEARLADVVRDQGGWTSPLAPEVTGLDAETCTELAAHWSKLGAMEHASIAAFARFTLELLSLGAPAELVAASQRALADEIRHAKLCFGLATAYAGHSLGPGPLSSEGALGAQSLDAIVETAIAEACIGETLAAVEAAEAAAHATDPSVRRVLLAIARDEKRHAELGWRFLAWVLDAAPTAARSELRARLGEIVEDARRGTRAETYDTTTNTRAQALLGHGVLDAEVRRATRLAALEELVTPLACALGERATERAA